MDHHPTKHQQHQPTPFLPRQRLFFVALAAIFVTLSGASTAAADADYERADHAIGGARPEVHMSVGGYGDFGAGFRIDLPIVPSGFLRNGRDEFALSPGMDIQFLDFGPDDDDDDDVLFMPQLATQWNFYFPRGWSIFPEVGLAVIAGDNHGRYDDDNVHVDGLFAFGARRHFSERTALVMRMGWPNGFQLGFAI
jgi:hypothetical protein